MSNEKRHVSVGVPGFGFLCLEACSDPENPNTSNWVIVMSDKELGELPEAMSRDEVKAVLLLMQSAYYDGRHDESRAMTRSLMRHEFKRR